MFRMQQISAATFAFVAVLVSSAITRPLHAQTVEPPVVEWERTFGGAGGEGAYSVQQTADGGYIVAGFTGSFGAGFAGVYLIKTDAQGNVIPGFPKTFGGAKGSQAYSIQQTTDGGYIMAGSTDPFSAAGYDAYLIKIDANGNVIPGWPKTFGGTGDDWASSVQQTIDGGYIVVGGTSLFEGGDRDVYLIKTDANGNLAPGFPKTFGGAGWEVANAVQQTTDGGYIVAGIIWPSGADGWDVYLIKTDANGNLAPGWPKTFGGANFEHAHSVQQTTDGGYIMVGETGSLGAGRVEWDVYLIKTDVNGNLVWQKTFGGANTDSASSVEQTTDGGYIVAGSTASFGAGEYDVYLIKLAPERPLPPTNLIVNYSAFRSLVTLTWEPSPSATVDRYIVERKLGCEAWQVYDDNFSASGPAVYHDGVPYGTSVCYRVSAANATDISKPTAPACLAVPSDSRYQLQIYDPDTPNPFNPDLGYWVDFYPCDWRFKPDRGTAVVVHGYNPDRTASLNQVTWTLEVAQAITETQRFTDADRPNILAWDWLEEAEGGEGLFVARYDRVYYSVENQARIFSEACRRVLPDKYQQPIHLMGYSFGSYFVASTGVSLSTTPNPDVRTFLVKQVTLWDPPTLAYANGKIEWDIRRLREADLDVYVEDLVGLAETGMLLANQWIDVPETRLNREGHNVYKWYITTIPANSDPSLVNPRESPKLGEGATIGFGTSILLGVKAHRPNDGCPAPNLGTLMFNRRWRSPDRVFHLRGYQCAFRDSSVQQDTANTNNGVFTGDCDPFVCVNQNPTQIALGITEVGAGAGGGVNEALTASFSLELTIDPAWDELSFQYDFTAVPAEAVLSFSLTVDGETQPLWQMSSGPILDEGLLESGMFKISTLQGKLVVLHFDLTSTTPGAQVAVQDITFWQSPTHGNRPPVANAGLDQTVPADDTGFTLVHLDASATTDADGDELLYWWELDDESFADGINPSELLCIGQHLIKLVVRDPVDNISTDEVLITVTGEPTFLRADSNNDGTVDISDAVNTLGFLFLGTSQVPCADAADANDSGILDISDAIFTLGFLFLGTPAAIPAPYPNLGPDPTTDPLGCERC